MVCRKGLNVSKSREPDRKRKKNERNKRRKKKKEIIRRSPSVNWFAVVLVVEV
jgi:hypothetical protein